VHEQHNQYLLARVRHMWYGGSRGFMQVRFYKHLLVRNSQYWTSLKEHSNPQDVQRSPTGWQNTHTHTHTHTHIHTHTRTSKTQ
jgi:hypothetical protein